MLSVCSVRSQSSSAAIARSFCSMSASTPKLSSPLLA
jgi:hypothetical protein